MSSPAEKAQSPASEAASPKGKAKSPTPGPASPATARASSAAPKSPTPAPATPAAARESTPAPEIPGLLSGAHWLEQGLPTADPESDWDSTLGSDTESSTASITSSILHYRTLNGRTYHSDTVTSGEYWGPNDEKQNEMLDIYHHTMTLVFDGQLYTAPISDDPKHVVDIGTGTGLWAIDFADKFPDCTVIGTDISPIQPTWVPPNLRFDIDDYTKEWAYKSNHFDYIHMRWLTGTTKDWTAAYKEAYRCLKPGGWIEHIDASGTIYSEDNTINEKNAMVQWGKIWQEAGRKSGNPVDLLERNLQEQGMKEAGFVNVTKKDYPIPVSPWPKDEKRKELGQFFYLVYTQDLEGLCQYMFGTVMGWPQEQIAVYLAHLRAELKNMSFHGLIDFRVVYAQKPLDAED
ncbi:S-adenosyl-L-methionine-dependent methyltransferase [Pseudoneurospora amorphoporcata]|uniref:S-adenosyl-L-methionine-dependent methyltransferase n=1 Tax=Pseudoneurospora amorphoporcata TaxID=241081 RepID=A0AAN6SA57_9PEZI|nr:S-adenosyl-L-methionine-dependent methyltransferase [Pseudoneurospora amorphoporcata]